jgi:hypothetical protein
MKIYQAVQNLLVGGHTDREKDRQTGDLISLISFIEIRLKTRKLSNFPSPTLGLPYSLT